jgi:hypothetical protein
MMAASTAQPTRTRVVVAGASAALNFVFAIWGVGGAAVEMHRNAVDWLHEPESLLLALSITMAVCASLSLIGLWRRWNGVAVALFGIPPLLWLGLLAIGAIAVTILGPV